MSILVFEQTTGPVGLQLTDNHFHHREPEDIQFCHKPYSHRTSITWGPLLTCNNCRRCLLSVQIWNGQSFRSKNSTVYYPPEFHQTQRSWDASPVRLGMLVPCFLPSVSWESDVFSCGSYSCVAVLWDQQYWRLKVMRTLGATKGGHLSTAATHLLLKWAAKVHSCCNTRRQTLKASMSVSALFQRWYILCATGFISWQLLYICRFPI